MAVEVPDAEPAHPVGPVAEPVVDPRAPAEGLPVRRAGVADLEPGAPHPACDLPARRDLVPLGRPRRHGLHTAPPEHREVGRLPVPRRLEPRAGSRRWAAAAGGSRTGSTGAAPAGLAVSPETLKHR